MMMEIKYRYLRYGMALSWVLRAFFLSSFDLRTFPSTTTTSCSCCGSALAHHDGLVDREAGNTPLLSPLPAFLS